MQDDQAQADIQNDETPAEEPEVIVADADAHAASVDDQLAAFQAAKDSFDETNDEIVEAFSKGELEIDEDEALENSDAEAGVDAVAEDEEVEGAYEEGEETEAEAQADVEGELGEETDAEARERQKAVRIRPFDDKEREYFELRRRYPDRKPEDLLKFVGLMPDQATADSSTGEQGEAEPQAQSEPEPIPRDEAEVMAEFRQLKSQKADILKGDFDTDMIADLEMREVELLEEMSASRTYQSGEKDRQEAILSEFRQSEDRVREANPEYDSFNSKFATRMRQIDEAWSEAGDKRANDPTKPEAIAKIVRKEFGLKNPDDDGFEVEGAVRQPRVATAGPSPARKKRAAVAPASGAARTHKPQQQSVSKLIQSATTPDSYEELKAKLLGG